MSTFAQLTVLWGATPIALTSVPRGRSVGITEGGVVTRASRDAALIVRAHARGVSVWRPRGATLGAARRRWLPIGADVEIAVVETGSAPAYRQGAAWEPATVVARIVVMAGDPRPRRSSAISARAAGAMGSVAAVHALTLTLSYHAMPALAPFDPDAFASSVESISFPIAAIPEESNRDAVDDERGGDATEVCAPDPLAGRSLSVQGPSDNPDPHIAQQRRLFPESFIYWFGTPSYSSGGDATAPTAPWGRDDSLGVDPLSATGTARGELAHPLPATCFDASSARWSCAGEEEVPASPSIESLGLSGIGEPAAPASELHRRPRSAHVEVGPIELSANVPRWVVVSGVRDAVEQARACYARALADDPTLTGRLDAVLKVRGDAVSVEFAKTGDVARSPELSCCVEHAHDFLSADLPRGTQATARYSLTFGG